MLLRNVSYISAAWFVPYWSWNGLTLSYSF